MKNISFPIFNVLASAIGIASIIIFLFIWQASSIIFNLEGVQKEIESRITKEFPGAKVSIKKINLSFEDFASPFGISVNDISIVHQRENIEIEEFYIWKDPSKAKEMLQRTNGARTIPQIFIGNHYIGGNDQLQAANRSGELDKLLS